MKKIATIFLIGVITVFTLCNQSYAQYVKLIDFEGTANGESPSGSLLSDGTFLYGMTSQGGTYDIGVIFKIKPDGTGYVKLLDFAGTSNGEYPEGSLISDGTFLYGMTSGGGTEGMGVIFKIKTDGTGYAKLLDFTGATTGQSPQGSLLSDGTFLYGMTSAGGTNLSGSIFKIKPDGTGYTQLFDFASTANGAFPCGSLISDGTFLYGMTYFGGTNNMGVIFKIKTDGTGYSKLLDFAGTTNGKWPSSLLSDGTYLYGTTSAGGTDDMGVIFKIKPDGTGFVKLLDFTGASGIAIGSNPNSSLISIGSYMYGMTYAGGSSNAGVLFKIKPDGTGYSKLLDFDGSNGASPLGSLISDGTALYGMTSGGGINNMGVIFKYNIAIGIAENNDEAGFNVYPNPGTGKFNILVNRESGITINELTICNMLGEQIVATTNFKQQKSCFAGKHTYEIDLTQFQKGIYFVKICDGKKIHTEKIVIQ